MSLESVRGTLTGQVAKVDQPQVTCRAAAIALPGDEVGEPGSELAAVDGRVHHSFAIRRINPHAAHGQRQHIGKSAFGRHRVELRVPRLAQPVGAEQNARAIGSPAHHAVGSRVKRHAFGNAAGDRHGEDVHVAVIFAAERQRLAIGGKGGIAFEARPRREVCGHAAIAADAP